MRTSGYPKIFSASAVCLLLVLAFSSFLAQDPQPSPTQTPEPTPAASPTPTPTPTPSPTPLPGAQNFHKWGSITVFNGLPSDAVRAIAQTPDGVMWFGTDNGLARFDGRRIQNFSFGSSDANRVVVLKTAPTGQLWIGTRAGAFVYSENGFQPIEGTQSVGITAVLLGPETFLGTDSGFVLLVKPGENATLAAEKAFPEPIKSGDGNPLNVTSLIEYEGKLLAGTPGGGVFVVENGRRSAYPTSPRPLFVNSLARSDEGVLWFGSDAAKGLSGIYLIDDDSRAKRVIAPTANVLALEENEGGLWAGTERYGLFQITESKLKKSYTFENTSGGLRSDTIFALFTDREGVIWIGTNRGVSRFDRLGPFQQTVSDIANSNFIRTLFRTADRTVYAGSNRGLFIQKNDKWIQVPAYGNKPIFALSEDRSGKLLVGSVERATGSVRRTAVEAETRSYADFKGAKYAAVSGLGLVQIGQNGNITRYSDESIISLHASGEKLWIGTKGNGLFSFDGQIVKSEIPPDTLKSGTIWRIFESGERALWIAGDDGVFRVVEGAPERIIETEDVRDVYVDGESVWAATTTQGLLHARHDPQFGWLVSSVGFEQGLPSEKAFSILPISEGMLIATNRGVVTYKPGTVAPKLIATRILSQRMHGLRELRSKIELEYPQNSLLVEVAGQSSRTFPEEFQYAFVLKNAKGEILDSRLSRDPQYAPADLKPGSYTIESTAFDRDLLSSDPLSIQFSVAKAPFPWTATALGVLLAIAVIALIWAIIERRRIVRSNRELAAARFDLATEAERERNRIARDLHDQTLADLRGLIMKSDRELPPGSGFRNEIESISTEVRRICEDLSPSVLENVGLIASLEFLLGHTVENYTFDAGKTTDDDIGFPMNIQLQIYRIAQEVLTNIRQHADATRVEMTITVPRPQAFEMTIVNDGKPFAPPEHNLRGGRGIAGIRSRAALINARTEWDETVEKQPRFRLAI